MYAIIFLLSLREKLILKHGYSNGQSKIFNINCRNDILLHFIKKGCQCSREDIVDVSDEQGFVKNLRNYPLDYGNDHLKDRETLVLLKVETNGEMDDAMSTSDMTVFTPMLVGLESNQEFNEVCIKMNKTPLVKSNITLFTSFENRSDSLKVKASAAEWRGRGFEPWPSNSNDLQKYH
ncbi:hypothetical protein ACJMK2_036069 [Sinanodonta woodiana]|uniref:Uncharacterized protein n=1 Tax=Sinanodonta woodiana TaxID=1069815 RepID=A0ABD3WJF1_SINWO